MSTSVVDLSVSMAMLKSLFDKCLISKEEFIKNYWEVRKHIKSGMALEQVDVYILDYLGIADTIYNGYLYELGLVRNTPNKDLPLIMPKIETEEAKEEIQKRLTSNG